MRKKTVVFILFILFASGLTSIISGGVKNNEFLYLNSKYILGKHVFDTLKDNINVKNIQPNVGASISLRTCEDECDANAYISGTGRWPTKRVPIEVYCKRSIEIFAYSGYRLQGTLITEFKDNMKHSTLCDEIDFNVYNYPFGKERLDIHDSKTVKWDVSSATYSFSIKCYVSARYTLYKWNYDTEEWEGYETDGCEDEATHLVLPFGRKSHYPKDWLWTIIDNIENLDVGSFHFLFIIPKLRIQ